MTVMTGTAPDSATMTGNHGFELPTGNIDDAHD
jgi:hypothetical protein